MILSYEKHIVKNKTLYLLVIVLFEQNADKHLAKANVKAISIIYLLHVWG